METNNTILFDASACDGGKGDLSAVTDMIFESNEAGHSDVSPTVEKLPPMKLDESNIVKDSVVPELDDPIETEDPYNRNGD